MPEALDHIVYLSQEIGPRPAGTEEEQQAALYITEQLQKEARLPASIEDFSSESNGEIPRALCAFLALVCTILAFFFSVMAIPSLIVAALAAFVYVMETLGRPVISRFFARGVSQNVVAKYEPGYSAETGSTRRRKIILVANYDSGKVKAELKGSILRVLPIIQKVVAVAMIALPVFLLIRYIFFLHAEGTQAIMLNVITGIILLFVAIPVILIVVHKFAPYNEAANCNASGVAVMLEIAQRVGRGMVSNRELPQNAAVTHGEEALLESGLVPAGSELVYQAEQIKEPDISPQSEADRLAAAKAAIAAMTGQSVGHTTQSSVADNLVQVKDSPIGEPTPDEMRENREETRGALGTSTVEMQKRNADFSDEAEAMLAQDEKSAVPSDPAIVPPTTSFTVSAGGSVVPDWYKKAQENAKKTKESEPQIQRSQYAVALDAAVAESSSYFNQANSAVNAETEERLRKMRDGIMEVQAPQAAREIQQQQVDARPKAAPTSTRGAKTSFVENPQLSQEEVQKQTHEQTHEQTQAHAHTQTHAQTTHGSPTENVIGGTIAMQPIDVTELHSSEAFIPEAFSSNPNEDNQVTAARRPIVLPDIGVSAASLEPLETYKQQRAPLAQAEEESSQVAAKSLLNMLPSIEIGEENPQPSDHIQPHADLRNSVPSLSGAIKENVGFSEDGALGSVNAAGSFASPSATGAFKPVGQELLQDVDPEDIYIEDADDSDYEASMTETGAFAGPGYVEMPKSRVRRFFDKFSFNKNKNDDNISAKEWLDVDEDFDARSVGAARGGWESFQDEDVENGEYYEEINEGSYRRLADDEWEGGAVSKGDIEDAPYDPDLYADDYAVHHQVSGEMERIKQFHNPGLDTEVWFVALGSELANNGGIKTFLNDHEQDLRGAIIVNLEGLASGDLCVLEKEGLRGKAGSSSRMKRYVRKAAQATGVSVGTQAVAWRESASTVAADKGIQAMTIAGIEEGKPARFAQGNDVLEHVDNDILHNNTEFVMELLRSI